MKAKLTQPKVSVIIPVYNSDAYIEQCLDSVLRQELRDIEIICIDDGSTDNTPLILQQYSKRDSRICVITQRNLYAGAARNNGLDAATGEYVHFLDADDYLTDNAYDNIYNIAHRHNLDWIKARAYGIDANTGEPVNIYTTNSLPPDGFAEPFSFGQAAEKLTSIDFCAIWGGLYKRSFLINNAIRFDALYCYNDITFYLTAAARAERIMVSDSYMLCYRRYNPSSLTSLNANSFSCHLEAYRNTCRTTAFLPRHEYELIQSVVIGHIFRQYSKAALVSEDISGMMSKFVDELEPALLGENGIFSYSPWYLDYLVFLWERDNKEDDIIKKLTDMCEASLPVSLKRLQNQCNIILYGAGTLGCRIYKVLKTIGDCNIIKWVDKNWQSLQEQSLPVCSPEELSKQHFDYVLVAVESPAISAKIQQWLVEEGVSAEKIVSNADIEETQQCIFI